MENYKTLISNIETYLETKQSLYKIAPSIRPDLLKTLSFSKNVLEKIEQNLKIEFTNDDVKSFQNTIAYLLNIFSELTIDEELKRFVKDYGSLIYNINKNVIKNQNLERTIFVILRFIEDSLTFNELINFIQASLKKFETRIQYKPKSFELSSHYFNLIEENK